MSGALPGVSQGQRVFFRNRPDDEVEGAESAANHRAFAVWFEDTKRWDTTYFRSVTWDWPDDVLVPLGDFLTRRQVAVEETTNFEDVPIIAKISFGGEVSVTEPEEREGYRGRLFWAELGDLIYSKIRIKQGSCALLTAEHGRIAVSAEYPVYSVNEKRAIPKYVELVLRSNAFRYLLDGLSVGSSTKTRIAPTAFEEMRVPLPSPEIQEAIVSRWRLAQEEIVAAQAGLRELYEELSAECYSLTTFAPDANPLKQRKVALSWDGLDVWDMKSARAGAFRTANPHFVPMRTIAQETTVLASPSREAEENPEKEWPVYGVNNREGVVFSHFQKGEAFNASYKRIQPNWFFHNPTRSAVGSLGIVPEGIETDAITSPEYQVWKIRDDRPDVPPDFIALLIRTTYFVDLVQVHRVGAVKQRLYTENLLDIPVPVFTEAQMQAYASRRRTTLERIAKARIAAKTAVLEVEEMILGKRPITH
jgi:hypothetical protein